MHSPIKESCPDEFRDAREKFDLVKLDALVDVIFKTYINSLCPGIFFPPILWRIHGTKILASLDGAAFGLVLDAAHAFWYHFPAETAIFFAGFHGNYFLCFDHCFTRRSFSCREHI